MFVERILKAKTYKKKKKKKKKKILSISVVLQVSIRYGHVQSFSNALL